MNRIITKFLSSLVLLVSISLCAQPATDQTAASVNSALLDEAKEAIAKNLTDPWSLQMRSLSQRTVEGKTMICGEANAKNSFGGYTGFKPFFFFKGAEEAGVLDLSVFANQATDSTDRISEYISQALTAGRLERFGCIEPGISAKLWTRIRNISQ